MLLPAYQPGLPPLFVPGERPDAGGPPGYPFKLPLREYAALFAAHQGSGKTTETVPPYFRITLYRIARQSKLAGIPHRGGGKRQGKSPF